MLSSPTWSVRANNATRDVWLARRHPGQPKFGLYLLPDGRDVFALVVSGRTDELPFVPHWRREQGARLGDLLWTGEETKIASAAMVEVLKTVEATGWSTFDVEVVDAKGVSLGDYVGLAVIDSNPEHDLRWSHGAQNFDFLLSDRVYQALRAAGAADFFAEVVEP